jgi:hypothetical protein
VRPLPYTEVVRALLALGCEIVIDGRYHVRICRGAAIVQAVPKFDPLPVSLQRRLLAALSFSEEEYLRALGGAPPA